MNIKCVVSYNGTNFAGWQKQINKRTIEGEIELALFNICKKEIRIIGAGRTDRGVHAYGQVFNFDTDININPSQWKKAINTNLPYDIRIKKVEIVDDQFHSRFSAKSKIYEYKLNMDEYDPINKDLIYQLGFPLNIDLMKQASKLFIGTHDFETFCSNSIQEVKDFTKEIYAFDIIKENNILKFIVEGSGFLRYQVRMMVGTLIEIGLERKDFSIITDRLDKKGASTTSYNAPSNGLYLVEVKY